MGASRRSVRGRRGLTLIELLVALSITVVGGVAIMTAITAVARAMIGMNDARSALQRSVTLHARLRSYSDMMLSVVSAEEGRGFVVWLEDTTPGGTMHLDEMRVFRYDAASRELRAERIEWPESMTAEERDAANLELTRHEDFFGLFESQALLGRVRSSVLADGFGGVEVSHDALTLAEAERVRLWLWFDRGADEALEILVALGIENHKAPA